MSKVDSQVLTKGWEVGAEKWGQSSGQVVKLQNGAIP